MRLYDLNEEVLAGGKTGALRPDKLSDVINPKTKKPFTRSELFLWKVVNGSPFELVSGGEVTIDPKEKKRVADWIRSGPEGTIALQTTDGQTVSNRQLQKTIEFGSKESEKIAIKPTDILTTQQVDVNKLGTNFEAMMQAGAFPANQMYEILANNNKLKAMGRVGDAVIYMAKQIESGQVPQVPKELSDAEKKAIELYAAEYLGVLAMIRGVSQFDKRDAFLKWAGQDIGQMLLYFPKASNNPIADSYSLLNRDTGNALAISSKGAGKGAPPSLATLKIPDLVKKKYPDAYEFIRTAQTKGTGKTQPFYMMNWLYQYDPNLVPQVWHKFLPWNESTIQAVADDFSGYEARIPKPVLAAAKKRLSPKVAQGTATDGGKIFYAVISDAIKAVNAGAVPNFREAILTALGFNFVQIYSKLKGDRLETKAFWPAKIDGRVILKTKSSAGEDKGKVGYQVSD